MNATPNRRGLLLGALTAAAMASAAAIAGIAAAEKPDPVFGLLEAHQAAFRHYLAFEEQLGDSEDLADFEALETAGRAVDVALKEITTTPPTTVAGMRDVIEYLVELDGHADYLPTLLRSSILRSPLLADKPCGTGIASA
jgi:hypothetical protein